MSDQDEQQPQPEPPVDLADIARRAGAEALAALIEAARGRPSATTVAAAKALIELGEQAEAAEDGGRVRPVRFTLHGARQVEQDEREPVALDRLSAVEFELVAALMWKAQELAGRPARNGHATGYADIEVTIVSDDAERLEFRADFSRLSSEIKEHILARVDRRANGKVAPSSQPWVPKTEPAPLPSAEPITSAASTEMTSRPAPETSAPPVQCAICREAHDPSTCARYRELFHSQPGWNRVSGGEW